MLVLQEYLRSGHSVKDLEKEFGIYSYNHPDLPLVGFKYGLIDSKQKQFHPIVRECRGIVLERDSWDVIAYPFTRFFNLGEDNECETRFNWNDFSCQEKVDGSLIIVYYYAGKWRVNTSGSFGQGVCYNSGFSWEDLFWNTSNIFKDVLDINNTYIFELWTKYNKIVRSYKEDVVKLLSIKTKCENDRWYELSQKHVDYESGILFVKRPEVFSFNNIDEIINYLKICEKNDPTFEGFVLCDNNFNRIKIKTNSYKQLHQLKGNSQFIYRNIIPQLLKGNYSTLSRVFPEFLEELESCNEKINKLKQETDNIWFAYQNIKDRKKFAKFVVLEATLPAVLFWLYDGKYNSVEEAFLCNEDLLVKYFESNGKVLRSCLRND